MTAPEQQAGSALRPFTARTDKDALDDGFVGDTECHLSLTTSAGPR